MAQSWLERLQAWREETEHKLRSTWYLWPIGFFVDLVWHRIYSNANEFLDSHGAGMLVAITSRIPSDPAVIAVILAVCIVLALAVHAYFDTKNGAITAPTIDDVDLQPASVAPKDAPRLRVDYVDDDGRAGGKGTLVFKTDKPAIVKSIGSLISRERYESQYEFSIIPGTPPPVDLNGPVECRIYGLRRKASPDIRSLVDILRGGPSGNGSVDSVIIDYDDDHGNEFSRRFDLTRNQDNSIAWIPAPEINLRAHARLPEPEWQNLADLRHNLYLASKFDDEHSASVQFARQLEEERAEVRRIQGEANRTKRGPKIEISPSSPQGGMILFDPALSHPNATNWVHFSLSIKNIDTSMSACDLIVTLGFEEESTTKTVRHVERAVFRTATMTFPSKLCCLEAGQSAECVIAVWTNSVGVQTIRNWTNGTPTMPLGDELYPGVWWCNVTAKAQGVEQYARYRFRVLNNSMSRFMLPPGTPGETG